MAQTKHSYLKLHQAWQAVLDGVLTAKDNDISSFYTCPNIENLYWSRRISEKMFNTMMAAVQRKAVSMGRGSRGVENTGLWREESPQRIAFIKRQLALAKRRRSK